MNKKNTILMVSVLVLGILFLTSNDGRLPTCKTPQVGHNLFTSDLLACGRTWPVTPEWRHLNDSSTATYTTNSCRLPPFPAKEEMTQCLTGRKVFLLGNSIARQFAYHVPILLGKTGDIPDRESQKKHCQKEYGGGGCAIDAPFNVTVRSFWVMYWNEKPTAALSNMTSWENSWLPDICGPLGIAKCLQDVVFKEFQPQPWDFLVTSIGAMYALADPVGLNPPDITSWRKHELRAFILELDKVFKGSVIWMTTSKFVIHPGKPVYPPFPFILLYGNARFKKLDAEIAPIIMEETNWTIYDGHHINGPLTDDIQYKKDFFADHIHFPGRLTHLGWQFILGNVCPSAAPVPK